MLPCFVLNRSHRFNNVMRAMYIYMFVGTGVLCMLLYYVYMYYVYTYRHPVHLLLML